MASVRHVQAITFRAMKYGEMGVWDALTLLNELREYEAALFASISPAASFGPGELASLPQTASSVVGSVQHEALLAGLRHQLATGPLSPEMPLLEHALQSAELCYLLHYPEYDFMPLLGLIAGLGKLLAHPRYGPERVGNRLVGVTGGAGGMRGGAKLGRSWLRYILNIHPQDEDSPCKTSCG